MLDASFSFDGVIGAFAITQDIFIIMIGLGVGAFWIRSLTVYLVRQGTLDEYVYLEHGAHWAIGALAVILLVTIKYEISEIITGLIGVGVHRDLVRELDPAQPPARPREPGARAPARHGLSRATERATHEGPATRSGGRAFVVLRIRWCVRDRVRR